MRLSELLQRLTDQLDDDGSHNWPEAERVRWADLVIVDLNRQLLEVDKGYCDLEFFVMETDWSQQLQLMQDFQLPPWVGNIIEVWLLTDAPDDTNPYVNTVELNRGSQIHKTNQNYDPGWLYTQRNVLRLHRHSTSPKISVTAAKRPARLLRTTLTTDATSTTVVEIPQTLGTGDVGTIHIEADWYRNEQFFVLSSTQDPAAHPVISAGGRCIRSESNINIGGTLFTRLTFERAWASSLKIGDVLELELAIPDEHSELVVLEVCAKAFIKKESTDGLAAIASDRAIARDAYRRYIQPRGLREPDFFRTDGVRRSNDHLGKDPAMEQYL